MNLDISSATSQKPREAISSASVDATAAASESQRSPRSNWLIALLVLLFALCIGKYCVYLSNRVKYCPPQFTMPRAVNGSSVNCTMCPMNARCDGYDIGCNEGFKLNYERTGCVKDEEITNQARAIIHGFDITLQNLKGLFKCG